MSATTMSATNGVKDFSVLLETCNSPDPAILFNDSPIKGLDFSKCSCTTAYGISYENPGFKSSRKLLMRPLERTDHSKGYLALLSQLTVVGEYGREVFEAQFDGMKEMKGCHFVVVVEDPGDHGAEGRLVASATLIIERKFIHHACLRGRIEDVVVDKEYRGMHLGSLLMETLKMFSQDLGCYKISLDCKDDMLPYYTKLGYVNEGQYFLTQRFSD